MSYDITHMYDDEVCMLVFSCTDCMPSCLQVKTTQTELYSSLESSIGCIGLATVIMSFSNTFLRHFKKICEEEKAE